LRGSPQKLWIARLTFPVLDLQVMNQVLHSVEAAKQIPLNVEIKLIAFSTRDATDEQRAERAIRDNQRRATEIGPVLENILQGHWRHWGLND
jgi:hypothetical protein